MAPCSLCVSLTSHRIGLWVAYVSMLRVPRVSTSVSLSRVSDEPQGWVCVFFVYMIRVPRVYT